jgi:hypothetical protein
MGRSDDQWFAPPEAIPAAAAFGAISKMVVVGFGGASLYSWNAMQQPTWIDDAVALTTLSATMAFALSGIAYWLLASNYVFRFSNNSSVAGVYMTRGAEAFRNNGSPNEANDGSVIMNSGAAKDKLYITFAVFVQGLVYGSMGMSTIAMTFFADSRTSNPDFRFVHIAIMFGFQVLSVCIDAFMIGLMHVASCTSKYKTS